MARFSSPFGSSDASGIDTSGDDTPDDDTYDPERLPEPGPFIEDHDVLTGDDHLAFHRVTHELFEQRGVYDVTFGYNLAELNRDARHPDAGYRYAEDADDPSVLWAEFTPTTPFCPQSGTLTRGSFRAWNAEVDQHDYDLVRVRLAPMHNEVVAINDDLVALEEQFEATGTVPNSPSERDDAPGGSFGSPF
ncbi:hypothetical protein [Halorarius litoreus]|uniref:hypothetical protein n=1 Tax=Halorarius litoreus TaxID=2962676 RepID=UPI0020CC9D78|nr:hypothetical protein [Halorarius litoreus]